MRILVTYSFKDASSSAAAALTFGIESFGISLRFTRLIQLHGLTSRKPGYSIHRFQSNITWHHMSHNGRLHISCTEVRSYRYANATAQYPASFSPQIQARRDINMGSSLVLCIVVLIAIRTALNRRPGARPKGQAPHSQLSPGGGNHVIVDMNELRGGHGSRKCGSR